MKTLKLFALIAIISLLHQHAKAQCGQLEIYPLHTGYDSIVVLPVNLASEADSAAATLIINYGDGNIDTTSSFDSLRIHGYASAGTYIVCMAYNSPGCTSTFCDTIEAIICPPQQYEVRQIFYAPGTVRLQVAFGPGSNAGYSWNLGSNASPATSTNFAPVVTFTGNGVYNLSVDITPYAGCSQTVDFVVNMSGCDAILDDTIINGLDVTLIAVDEPGLSTYWAIDQHFYVGTGPSVLFNMYDFKTYDACLYTTSAACRDTLCTTVTTTPPSGSIYGHVNKGSYAACSGKVYLLQETSPNVVTAIDSTDILNATGCLGVYSMPVPAGAYYLQARLTSEDVDSALYVPTFYGDDEDFSDAISITADSTGNLVINLQTAGPGLGTAINEMSGITLQGVFPNPASDKATIRFDAKQSGTAVIQLTDVKGAIQATNTVNTVAGNNEISLDLANQASGLYYLSITTNRTRQMVKLVKAN